LPEELRKLVTDELDDSEQLLWCGKPRRWDLAIRFYVPVLQGAIPYAVVVTCFQLALIEEPFARESWPYQVMGPLFFFLLLPYLAFEAVYAANRLAYMITDRRAAIIKRTALGRKHIDSFMPQGLRNLGVRRRPGGTGTILFKGEKEGTIAAPGLWNEGFLGIANVEEVEAMLRRLESSVPFAPERPSRRRQTPSESMGPSHAPLTELTLPRKLRNQLEWELAGGEPMRWHAQPDPVRLAMPSVPLAVFGAFCLVLACLLPSTIERSVWAAEVKWQIWASSFFAGLLGALCVLSPVRFYLRARGALYAIVGRHTFVVAARFLRRTRMHAFSLAYLEATSRIERPDGSGNVVFSRGRLVRKGIAPGCFSHIANVRQVDVMLRQSSRPEAQTGQTPVPAGRPT
jgi:hypothetical protein